MAERKAIFITGGGSGIGRAIGEYFAGRGWFVGLGDIDDAGMTETQARIGSGFTYARKFDVRDRAGWTEALEAFSIASGGRIDVVANNAGIPLGGSLDTNTTEEIERCLDINLKGVLFGAQAALPHLKKTAPGSCLLNTASAAGIYGTGGASVYSATKFGVRGITEALDAEWAEFGIKVRDLMPGFIDTPLLDHAPNQGIERGDPQPGDRGGARDHSGSDGGAGGVGRGSRRAAPHAGRQDRAAAGVRRALDARPRAQAGAKPDAAVGSVALGQ